MMSNVHSMLSAFLNSSSFQNISINDTVSHKCLVVGTEKLF